jgi:hypothetical protein
MRAGKIVSIAAISLGALVFSMFRGTANAADVLPEIKAPALNAIRDLTVGKLDDRTQTGDVSFRTPIDSDGDGLRDTSETVTTYGTLPLNPDSDNDGFPDGAEAVNPAWGDPNNVGIPGPGGKLYFLLKAQAITTGTENCSSPSWLFGRMAYREEGNLCFKGLRNLSNPRIGPIANNLDMLAKTMSPDPLYRFLYMDAKEGGIDTICRVPLVATSLTTPIRVLTYLSQSIDYPTRDPQLVGQVRLNSQTREWELTGDLYLLVSADHPTSGTELYLFRLANSGDRYGLWDGSNPIRVTNLQYAALRPRLCGDGKRILCNDNYPPKGRLFIFDGLQDIIAGTAPPFTLSDNRGSVIVNGLQGVKIPIGWNEVGNFAWFSWDTSNKYIEGSPDFSGVDFDIVGMPTGYQGSRFEQVGPITRFPLPGSQICGDIRGGWVAVADNYLRTGVPENTFNIYVFSVAGGIKAKNDNAGQYYSLITPWGTEIEIPAATRTFVPSPERILISPLYETITEMSGSSALTNINRFEPNGSSFEGIFRVRMHYTQRDLKTWDGQALDESRIQAVYQEGNQLVPMQNQILSTPTMTVEGVMPHFSQGAIRAPILNPLPQQSLSVNWQMYR